MKSITISHIRNTKIRFLVIIFVISFYLTLCFMYFVEVLHIYSLIPGIGFVSIFGMNFLKTDVFFFFYTSCSMNVLFLVYVISQMVETSRIPKIRGSFQEKDKDLHFKSQYQCKFASIIFIGITCYVLFDQVIQIVVPLPSYFLITILIEGFIVNFGLGLSFAIMLILFLNVVLTDNFMQNEPEISFYFIKKNYFLILNISSQCLFFILSILRLLSF